MTKEFSIGLSYFSSSSSKKPSAILSSFLFARDNTKIPFYFSLFSVFINILISVYFFNKIGFIIIPIATTISSWINALILLIFLLKKKYFSLNSNFIFSSSKIILSTTLTSYIFYNLIKYFAENLTYESEYKIITIILLVIITLIIYVLISIFTKAFNISDIKLKY